MPTNVKLYLTTGENMTEDDRLRITLDSIAATEFNPSPHDHDDRYYTESEVDAKLSLKASLSQVWQTDVVRTKNTILAAPDGANGTASFRTLAVADLPNIPISKGGTGATTASGARTNLNAQLAHARLTSLSNLVLDTSQGDGRFLKLLTGDSFAIDYNTYVTSTYLTTNYYNKSQTNNEINTKIANLVDSAPDTLDTLNKLATALGNDPNFATTVANNIAAKVPSNRSIAGLTLENDITSASLTSVLDLATTSKRGLMSSDDKTKLNGAAPLASPAFTGNPTAPTQATSNNSNRLATTKFVHDLISEGIGIAGFEIISQAAYVDPSFQPMSNVIYIVVVED